MDNYTITVKWPDGMGSTQGDYTRESAYAMADLLWACGADDVIVRCACGECETCTDNATFEGC